MEVGKIKLEQVPVGIKLMPGTKKLSVTAGTKLYSGPAYCDAVSRASRGEKLLITGRSIKNCRWAPAVLGLKEPENKFERGLTPHLEALEAVCAFPLGCEKKDFQPDLVIFRERPALIKELFEELGKGRLDGAYARQLDKSALAAIDRNSPGARAGAVNTFNRLLCTLKEYRWFRRSSELALKSPAACYLFDKISTLFLVDMSVCRNSTVIPALEGRGNCSYFCSGGIFWGGNDPAYMTAGLPYEMFCCLQDRLFLTWTC